MGKSTRRTQGVGSFVSLLSSTSEFQTAGGFPFPSQSKALDGIPPSPKPPPSNIDESNLLPCGSVIVDDTTSQLNLEDTTDDSVIEEESRPAKRHRISEIDVERQINSSVAEDEGDTTSDSDESMNDLETSMVLSVDNSKTNIRSGPLPSIQEAFDATGLVHYYTHKSQVPKHLQKYFAQRYRYFSLYDNGCLLDEEGWYSVTPEGIANQIAERCRCETILDAFCGVGGNAIAFAKTCERVIALDTSPTRLALARHNAVIYGVADRIEFILCDYISFARSYREKLQRSTAAASGSVSKRPIDVVFLSPPWGGPEYISGSPNEPVNGNGESLLTFEYSLSSVKPIHGEQLFNLTRQNISHNIAFFLPRNTSLQEIGSLVKDGYEKTEIEEEWMGDKLKALTCYFGGLVTGQEEMF
ncbi:hypothetical protein FRC02_011181 [Tulasnella sp. 418]|nr:hypothetical protein FRC02_011181 [Tulasnella sp. 418]